jgi:hypothetical protein
MNPSPFEPEAGPPHVSHHKFANPSHATDPEINKNQATKAARFLWAKRN